MTRALLVATTLCVTACFVQTPGAQYAQGSQPAPGQPAPGQPAPQGTPVPAQGQPGSPDPGDVIATGQYGTLTSDNALAFYEALVFCLQYVGQGQLVAEIEKEKFLQLVAQHYPSGTAEVQQNLANARQLWNDVQARWHLMGRNEQGEFIYAVLELGIGTPAAQRLTGRSGPSGTAASSSGSASSPSLDSLDGSYAGSDCWAAAGCADYDAGSGTYTMEDPPMPSGDY